MLLQRSVGWSHVITEVGRVESCHRRKTLVNAVFLQFPDKVLSDIKGDLLLPCLSRSAGERRHREGEEVGWFSAILPHS